MKTKLLVAVFVTSAVVSLGVASEMPFSSAVNSAHVNQAQTSLGTKGLIKSMTLGYGADQSAEDYYLNKK